jgi:hypothetical protein
MTWREVISRVKKELKEVNADSRLPNKLIYSKIVSKSSLLMQRESDALRLGKLQLMYQTLKCMDVQEVPAVDKNCFISSSLKLYRTCNKIPDLYSDLNGVIVKSIRSVDRFGKEIKFASLDYIVNVRKSSNSKFDKSIYGFYEDGYIYLEKKVPVRIEGAFTHSVEKYQDCECSKEATPCQRFLDTKWFIPQKLEDAIITMCVQELANGYKRLPEQMVIDKNPNT